MYQVSNVWIKDEGVTVEAFDIETGEIVKRFLPSFTFFGTLMLPTYPKLGARGSLYDLGLTMDSGALDTVKQ